MSDDKPPRRRQSDVIADWIRSHEESDRIIHESFQRTQELTLVELKGLREDMKPLVQVYQGAQFGGKALKVSIAFLLSLGALAAMFYQALKWVKGA